MYGYKLSIGVKEPQSAQMLQEHRAKSILIEYGPRYTKSALRSYKNYQQNIVSDPYTQCATPFITTWAYKVRLTKSIFKCIPKE